MKKYFSFPQIHIIDLNHEDVLTASFTEIGISPQDLYDEDDSKRGNSRGGIWDD